MRGGERGRRRRGEEKRGRGGEGRRRRGEEVCVVTKLRRGAWQCKGGVGPVGDEGCVRGRKSLSLRISPTTLSEMATFSLYPPPAAKPRVLPLHVVKTHENTKARYTFPFLPSPDPPPSYFEQNVLWAEIPVHQVE